MTRPTRLLLPLAAAALWLARPAAGEQVREVEVMAAGQQVHALCTQGSRRVMLLHDGADGAESWRPVLDRLRGVGACAYDRAGGGSSEGGVPERGWYELLEELRTVHAALGADPPYVLVGHGIGGMYARLYAVDRAIDVGGLLLLDPAHEDLPREARSGMPGAAWTRWMEERQSPNVDGVREADLARRLRGTRLPDIPVTVVTAMDREAGDGWNTRFVAEAARRVHASILHGVGSARHVPAVGSGPDVPREAPDLVAEEIERMVRMVTGEATR